MKKSFVGGQAVLEGVLMVFEDAYAVAIQTPKGITVKKQQSSALKSKLLKVPFIRGPIALMLMAKIGFSSMMYASQESSEEGEELSWATLITVLVITLGLALTIFKFVPLLITTLLITTNQPLLFNIVDGILRITLVIAYIALIAKLPDIKRLFEYHGAEHKVINAYENSKPTLAQARKQSRYLSRCGTTFVVIVLLVAIFVYTLTPIHLPIGWLLLLRIAFLIPIASLSYELMRLSFTRTNNPLVKILLAPGYWVQKLTVREPNDQQLKVALTALQAITKD